MNRHEFRLAALGRHTPMRAFYDPDTEAQAWSKLLDFFSRHTGA